MYNIVFLFYQIKSTFLGTKITSQNALSEAQVKNFSIL